MALMFLPEVIVFDRHARMHPFKGHLSREKTIPLTRKCNFLVDVFLS